RPQDPLQRGERRERAVGEVETGGVDRVSDVRAEPVVQLDLAHHREPDDDQVEAEAQHHPERRAREAEVHRSTLSSSGRRPIRIMMRYAMMLRPTPARITMKP